MIPIDIIYYIRDLCDIDTKISLYKAIGIMDKINSKKFSFLNTMRKPHIQSKSSDICLLINTEKFYCLWKCPSKTDRISLINICNKRTEYLEQYMCYGYNTLSFTKPVEWTKTQ
jgi:hypothetical protein